MTHSVNAPLPPPSPSSGATTQSASTQSIDSPSSTKDVAKNEAANVGQTAKEAGSQVENSSTLPDACSSRSRAGPGAPVLVPLARPRSSWASEDRP